MGTRRPQAREGQRTGGEEHLPPCYQETDPLEAARKFAEFDQGIRSWVLERAWLLLRNFQAAALYEEARDITQTVLINVWRTWHNPSTRWNPDKGTLRAWMGAIIANAVKCEARRKCRFREMFFSQTPENDGLPPEPLVVANADNPSEGAALAEMLEGFLDSLGPNDRELFDLMTSQAQTQRQTARALGITDVELSRRWKALRERLADLLGTRRI